jgi:translation initiation factor IF-2
MDGAKKAEDKLNTVGIVTVGICGAVLVYVSIVLLQAFYMNETSAVSQITDNYGAQDELRTLRSAQVASISEYRRGGTPTTAAIPVQRAMELVVNQVKAGNSSNLVPAVGPSDKATLPAVFGRPDPNAAPPAAPAPAAGTPEAGAPGAAAPAAGAAAPAPGAAAPTTGAADGSGAAATVPASGQVVPTATPPGTPPAAPATGGAAAPSAGAGGAPGQPAPSPGATPGGNGH